MGELQLRAFHKQFGITGIACRIFTAYGERENETHAVNALIAKALERMDPYPVWGTGLQTQNFTYVQDTVTGMVLAGALLSGFETINVGPPSTTPFSTWRKRFSARSNGGRRDQARAGSTGRSEKPRGGCVQVQALLNWSPETSLEQGISNTAGWCVSLHGSRTPGELEQLLMDR